MIKALFKMILVAHYLYLSSVDCSTYPTRGSVTSNRSSRGDFRQSCMPL